MTHPTARLAGVFAAIVLISGARAAQPWDTPFARDTASIVDAAKGVTAPEGQALVVLLDDQHYSIDSRGRVRSTLRKVYRIFDKEDIEEWTAVEQSYQPWYQQKPLLRARVIGADGAAQWLDPKTIAESPAVEYDSSIFSDRRVVRAPLPNVVPGAVVEYEISVVDKLPLLDAGVVSRITVEDTVPLERFHVLIEADKAIVLRTAAQLIPDSALRRENTKSGARVECELDHLPIRKDFEFNLPSNLSSRPYLSFSTGRSWQEVAAAYEAIVDRQIQAGDVHAMLEGIDAHQPAAVLIPQLAAKLHKQARYTGVEFGEAAIVPANPAETLKRGYGDCKDKSALLVASLRAAGLKAYLALLDSGFGTDVDPGLPGMGLFDHAIVYVAADPPLWIDATAENVRVGALPSGDQGRLALVARNTTTSLVKTPESESKDNWERHTIAARLSEYGPGDITEIIEAGGTREADLRAAYASDEAKNRKRLESYVKQTYLGKLGKFQVSRKDEWNAPFHLSVEALQSARASTDMDSGAVGLLPQLLFSDLPFALQYGGEADENDKKREHDFVLWEPQSIEYRYRIVAPPLFKPASLPSSEELKLGPATYSRTFGRSADGAIEVVYRFDTGKRVLTPAEFTAFREGLQKHSKATPELITFVPATAEHMALGETGKALALVRDYVGQHPDEATAHVRLSRMLIAAGLGGAALQEANRAVELNDKSSQAWQALGWAYQHDFFGRRFAGNWSRSEAEKCYRQALAIDPDDHIAAGDLAILLEHSKTGVRYGAGSNLAEAIELYRGVQKKQPIPQLQESLELDLLYSGQVDAAKEHLKNCSAEAQATFGPVITALQEGAAKSIISVQASYPDVAVRQLRLLTTAVALVRMRRYDVARPILAAAARLRNDAGSQALLDMMGRIKRYEDTLLPESDPRSLVQRLLLELFLDGQDSEKLKPLFSGGEPWADRSRAIGPLRKILAMVRHGYPRLVFSDENIADLTLSAAEFEKSGEDGYGYVVVANIPNTVKFPAVYVIREGGQYRILASNDSPGAVGKLVLDLLQKNDIKGAQWWLDTVVAQLTSEEDGTGYPAVRSLWSGLTPATRGPRDIELAASSMIGRDSGSETALRILRQVRAKAATDLERAQIDKAICETLRAARNWPELMVAAKRLSTSKAFPEEGFRYAVQAAAGVRNWTELEALAQQRLKSNPENVTALRAVVIGRTFEGNRTGAAEATEKVLTLSFAGTEERLFEAWGAMLGGRADQKLLTKLKEERSLPDKDSFYTLAMLQAVLKMPEDAQQSLNKAIELEYSPDPDVRAWVIYGKVCEQYGFAKEAAAAFSRAKSALHDDEQAEWALALISR